MADVHNSAWEYVLVQAQEASADWINELKDKPNG